MSKTHEIFTELESKVHEHLKNKEDVPQDLWKRYYQMLTILGKKSKFLEASLEAKRAKPEEKPTAHDDVF